MWARRDHQRAATLTPETATTMKMATKSRTTTTTRTTTMTTTTTTTTTTTRRDPFFRQKSGQPSGPVDADFHIPKLSVAPGGSKTSLTGGGRRGPDRIATSGHCDTKWAGSESFTVQESQGSGLGLQASLTGAGAATTTTTTTTTTEAAATTPGAADRTGLLSLLLLLRTEDTEK